LLSLVSPPQISRGDGALAQVAEQHSHKLAFCT
jgi:hypothetical protein